MDLVQEKNVGWIFVQKPMQMDLVQYKVLHMTFELTRTWMCIAVHVIKHLEIGLNLCAFLFNLKIVYTAR